MDRLSIADSTEIGQQHTPPQTRHAEAPGATGAVDVALLADKVYRLLLADLRLSQARGAVDARRNG